MRQLFDLVWKIVAMFNSGEIPPIDGKTKEVVGQQVENSLRIVREKLGLPDENHTTIAMVQFAWHYHKIFGSKTEAKADIAGVPYVARDIEELLKDVPVDLRALVLRSKDTDN